MSFIIWAGVILWHAHTGEPIDNDMLAFGILLMWADIKREDGWALTWRRREGWKVRRPTDNSRALRPDASDA